MAKNDTKIKVISLKSLLDFDSAEEMVDSRKVKTFQTLLHKPKKSEVHLHSLTLHYESILLLSGKYSVDFIRDADHTLHVDKDCLLYTSPSPRDQRGSRMPSSA